MTEPGELGEWRWAQDSWMPTQDHQAHFAIGMGLYFTFVHLYLAEWISTLIVILLEVCYQIKDGLVPNDGGKEILKYFGGDGFSYKDLIYDVSGITFALIIDLIAPPHVRGTITPSQAETAIESTPASGSGDSGIDSFNLMHLNAHNAYRAHHQVSDLVYDADIASQAQAYAEKLQSDNAGLVHSSSADRPG